VARPERQLHPERSARARFGYELRMRRKAQSLSQDRLGALLHVSGDLVHKIELGERRPSRDLAEQCERVLGCQGALLPLWGKVEAEAQRPCQTDSTDTTVVGIGRLLEHVAAPLTSEMMATQTAGPAGNGAPVAAGAALASDVDAGRIDVDGQIVVPCRTSDGRIIWVSVPRRAFLLGGIGTVAAAATGNLAPLKPVGASARLAELYSSGEDPYEHFRHMRTVLRDSDNLFGPRRVTPMVHEQIATVHQLRGGLRGADRQKLLEVQAQFADLLAWLYQDSGNHGQARYWLDRALDWSHMAGNHEGVAFILARKSQLAGDMHEPNEAVDVAEAALRQSEPRYMRTACIAATYAAHGHALQADKLASQRQYDHAYDLLAKVEDEPDAVYGLFLNEAYIEVQRAYSLAVLGDYKAGFKIFDDAIKTLPASYHRDRGVYLIRKALTCADAATAEESDASENANEAAIAGLQSLAIGTETNSSRIVTGLVTLDGKLKLWQKIPKVAEFCEAMNDLQPMLVGRTD
jgi:transcriptional regulator with XRE-family HTH domain/tetratricopeptide (TPR) repeat protein